MTYVATQHEYVDKLSFEMHRKVTVNMFFYDKTNVVCCLI